MMRIKMFVFRRNKRLRNVFGQVRKEDAFFGASPRDGRDGGVVLVVDAHARGGGFKF